MIAKYFAKAPKIFYNFLEWAPGERDYDWIAQSRIRGTDIRSGILRTKAGALIEDHIVTDMAQR